MGQLLSNPPRVESSRIAARLDSLHRNLQKGLIIYLTAGDPTLDDTGPLLEAAARGGADLIELGVPFSDPLADGPVIQRASERALRAGATLRKVLARFSAWRKIVPVPVILFTYYNPVLQYGIEAFARNASLAGLDGALVVDLAPEESEAYVAAMREPHLDTVFLAAPTSTDSRLERVAGLTRGFLYLVSRTGVTGERAELAASLQPLVERARRLTALPLAAGFGISNAAQVMEAQSLADSAVVGSAVVRAIEERYRSEGAAAIERFVRWLKSGVEGAGGTKGQRTTT